MAAWDFIIKLSPQQWLDAGGGVDTLLSSAAWETWKTGNVESIARRIGSILPLVKSNPLGEWSELAWGDRDEDDTENGIQLLVENGRIRSLGARWDLRRPNVAMFGQVVDVAKDLRLALFDVARKHVVPADVNALLWAAATARGAWHWKERSSFLRNAGRGNGPAA